MYGRTTWLMTALLAVLFIAAGCQQTKLVAPAPTFEAPRVQAPPVQLPTVPTIPQVTDPLVPGVALTPKVKARPWKWIVVHHSDTPMGSAARFDKAHKARGWEMLGYDFVIGNGTETRDGLIEVGPRWVQQKTGAHTGTPDHRFNDYGIGICLVGHFDHTRPTKAQMDSLARLCAYLMKTYKIPPQNILGHRDCKPTACPGRNMDIKQVRQLATAYSKR